MIICDACVDMHIEDETLCCNAAKDRREIYGERKCVTEVTAFSLICLEREVLETALSGWDRIVGENNAICNKSYRFIAYKQYISWIHGKLGNDVRIRIRTCVLYKIRQTFPAPDNIYVPFIEK